jgi:hypothetical protein
MVEKVAATTDPSSFVHEIASDADRDLSQAGQEQPAAFCDAPLEQDRLIRSPHHSGREHPDPLVAKIEREPAHQTVERQGRPERLRIDR